MQEVIFSPSDFVAVLNQTLEYAYSNVSIVGELSNFKVSKGRWVYFDLKDDTASVKFFGTVYNLPGPLEDGMMLQVVGQPRLSAQYGFSITTQTITPVGEGSLKRAADLLFAKLAQEGLFEPGRKRALPYPPVHIGLIASKESAAYADFNKILNNRFGGVKISHVDVQVQGEQAIMDIVQAVELLNQHGVPPEVIVITRGGGSADDLAVFSTEQVTRAVAASRIPTLLAIGHEVDVSLAELAADVHASTPSNAAEILVPDKKMLIKQLAATKKELGVSLLRLVSRQAEYIEVRSAELRQLILEVFQSSSQHLKQNTVLLRALNPEATLKRGYAVIRTHSGVVKSIKHLKPSQLIDIQLQDGRVSAIIKEVQ